MKIMLENGAFMPERAHQTDAGYDLRSPVDIEIPPAERHGTEILIGGAFINTGVHIQLPHGYFGAVKGRSGMSVKHDISVFEGTIDEGYRGSIGIKMYNLSPVPYQIHKGDKIAQLVIQNYNVFELNQVDELDESDRNEAGFGSTGR